MARRFLIVAPQGDRSVKLMKLKKYQNQHKRNGHSGYDKQ